MRRFTRHLVSRHLGRGVATVFVDDLDIGSVHRVAESPDQLSIRFDLVLDTVQRVIGEPDTWPERATRPAVSQARTSHANILAIAEGLPEPLNLVFLPWTGDLLPTSYGGTSAGTASGTH